MSGLETLKSMGFVALQIPLNQGQWATIDLDDAPLVLRFHWYAHRKTDTFYAVTRDAGNTLHGLLCEGQEMVDHWDGNGLNNRRRNLRPCENSQNQANARKLRRDNSSGFKGVSFTTGKWRAYIRINRKKIYLGGFDTPEEAAEAYDHAAKQAFGEFAATNKHLKS